MRAEELLDQIEDHARGRLQADLRSLHGKLHVQTIRRLVLRHPALTLSAAALASASLAPLLARLLRSPARAVRLARFAAPFVQDVLGASRSEPSPAGGERRFRTRSTP